MASSIIKSGRNVYPWTYWDHHTEHNFTDWKKTMKEKIGTVNDGRGRRVIKKYGFLKHQNFFF